MPVRPESAHWRYRATTHAVRTVPTIASATLRHASRPIGMLRSRFTVPVLQLVGALQPGRLERGLERERAHSADRLRALNRPGESGDSISWEGWSHVSEFVEEVSAGAA